MQYATNNNVGLSNSMKGSANQAAAISIQGRSNIYEAMSESNARLRVPKVNAAINSATITAYVHVEKLALSQLTN